MKRILIAVAVVIVVLFTVASHRQVAAQNQGAPLICTDTLSGVINQNVFVPDGRTCVITNAQINGSVQVGTLTRSNSQGGVTGGAFLWAGQSVITGNVAVGPGSAVHFTLTVLGNLRATGGSTALVASSVQMDAECNGGAAGVITGGTTIGGSNTGCPTGTLDNLTDFLGVAFDKGTGNGTGKGPLGPIFTCQGALGFGQVTTGLTSLLNSLPDHTDSLILLGGRLTALAEGLEQGACGTPGTTPGI
jgi:translation initiation factor 6 (eIF-6)